MTLKTRLAAAILRLRQRLSAPNDQLDFLTRKNAQRDAEWKMLDERIAAMEAHARWPETVNRDEFDRAGRTVTERFVGHDDRLVEHGTRLVGFDRRLAAVEAAQERTAQSLHDHKRDMQTEVALLRQGLQGLTKQNEARTGEITRLRTDQVNADRFNDTLLDRTKALEKHLGTTSLAADLETRLADMRDQLAEHNDAIGRLGR